MKRFVQQNMLILLLLCIGAGGMFTVEAWIKPKLKQNEIQYALDQQNPVTHDLDSILKYKSMYMGNAGNLSNLNLHLPLADIPRTFQLYPDELTAELHFVEKTTNIDTTLLHQALLYNATANFALIDNLDVLTLKFQDYTYTITRSTMQNWYNEPRLVRLLDAQRWRTEVQGQLVSREYVERFMSRYHQEPEEPSHDTIGSTS